ncbi:MAG: hypothetical protein V3S16_15900, partial [Candidatus Desulfatibia sp.]
SLIIGFLNFECAEPPGIQILNSSQSCWVGELVAGSPACNICFIMILSIISPAIIQCNYQVFPDI